MASPSAPVAPSSEGTKPTNTYIHRQASTAKPCYVCHKPSPHVLVSSTLPTSDFLYTCLSHLADTHFATRISTPPSTGATGVPAPCSPDTSASAHLPAKVSTEEIERIKREWEERQQKLRDRQAKSNGDSEAEGKKDKDKDKDGAKEAKGMAASLFDTLSSAVSGLSLPAKPPTDGKASSTSVAVAPGSVSTAERFPLHARYALHREFYGQRVREWNAKQARIRERQINLPKAPSGALPQL